MSQVQKLKDENTQLVLRRSQAKDIIEHCEREIQKNGFAITLLEEAEKESSEVIADLEADLSRRKR